MCFRLLLCVCSYDAWAQRNAWIAAWATILNPWTLIQAERPLLKIENQMVRAYYLSIAESDPYSSF